MADHTPNSPPLAMDIPGGGSALTGIAPKFPPQNFDVPDINFSNSVTPDMSFDQTSYSPALAHSSPVYPGGFAPTTASNSPSSGSDSDDLPLAQLAKRVNPSSSPSPSNTSVCSDGPGNKKGKVGKKKKKKDPNEPQKPVSAYALFFRDTQATIKGHNPTASFGDISKIVASMWDLLDPLHKENYKKKTEMEKKKYLAQLAAYRANQVSQSAPEESDKTLSPSPPSHSASCVTTSSPPSMPVTSTAVETNSISVQSVNPLGSLSNPGLPQPQTMMTQKQTSSPQHLMTQSPPQPTPTYTVPPQTSTYQSTPETTFSKLNMNKLPVCQRVGCVNQSVENVNWEAEYCSNDCVITHCREVFSNWVAQRSGSFQVK